VGHRRDQAVSSFPSRGISSLLTSRYAIDIHLLSDDRYLITDASSPSPDGLVDLSCGTITPLPDLSTAVDRVYNTLRTAHTAETARGVLAVKLDDGNSLVARVGVIGDVVRGLCGEIDAIVAGTGKI
jgi:hypothetical protein